MSLVTGMILDESRGGSGSGRAGRGAAHHLLAWNKRGGKEWRVSQVWSVGVESALHFAFAVLYPCLPLPCACLSIALIDYESDRE